MQLFSFFPRPIGNRDAFLFLVHGELELLPLHPVKFPDDFYGESEGVALAARSPDQRTDELFPRFSARHGIIV